MIQKIFVNCLKKLKSDFQENANSHQIEQSTCEVGQDFFNYRSFLVNGNISYQFYDQVFSLPKFRSRFIEYMRNGMLNDYSKARRAKLLNILKRWEGYFLQTRNDKDALDCIKREIGSPRFKFVNFDADFQKFF